MQLQPKLSVVVVCLNSPGVLGQTLAAIEPQMVNDEVEVLVVGHCNARSDYAKIRSRFPGANWVAAPDDYTVPQMRALGIGRSQGEIVALLEDDCVVNPAWCREVIRAHEAPHSAIGGAIAPGPRYSRLDWAVYLSEYGRFMPPFSGVVAALPGNNVTYKRAILSDAVDEAGFQDVFFHWRLQQAKTDLIADSGLAVTNVNQWSFGHVTATPFHHGRAFAARRAAELPGWRRGFYAALTIALPFVKVARITREVFGRGIYVRSFLSSLHWTFLFMAFWSAGEYVGCVFGAGDSASRWK